MLCEHKYHQIEWLFNRRRQCTKTILSNQAMIQPPKAGVPRQYHQIEWIFNCSKRCIKTISSNRVMIQPPSAVYQDNIIKSSDGSTTECNVSKQYYQIEWWFNRLRWCIKTILSNRVILMFSDTPKFWTFFDHSHFNIFWYSEILNIF